MEKLSYNLLQHYKNLGIPRRAMPQLRGDSVSDFLKKLRGDGVRADKTTSAPSDLKPTQRHIDSEKVDGFKGDVNSKHIVVARDGHILDGHHRWAKAMIEDRDKMKVIKIDMPIKKLIREANEFDKVAVITPTPTGFTVNSRSGRVLGTHATRELAMRQERAIAISKRAFLNELQKQAGVSQAVEDLMPMADDLVLGAMNYNKDKKQKQQPPMQKLSEMSMIRPANSFPRVFTPSDLPPATTSGATSQTSTDSFNAPGNTGGVATI